MLQYPHWLKRFAVKYPFALPIVVPILLSPILFIMAACISIAIDLENGGTFGGYGAAPSVTGDPAAVYLIAATWFAALVLEVVSGWLVSRWQRRL